MTKNEENRTADWDFPRSLHDNSAEIPQITSLIIFFLLILVTLTYDAV
jgi:hypothetical protein